MQTTEGSHCRSNEILHLSRIAHVSLHENSISFFALNRLHRLRSLGIDIADHNFCAVSCKQDRCSTTNTAAATGNQRNLVCEIEWVVCFHLEAAGEEIAASFGKMVFQSFFMLTTVQPFSFASSQALSSLPTSDLRS